MSEDFGFIETAPRGCGYRKKGALYAVLPTGPGGVPIETFLVCPPQRLNFDVPAQGMLPIWMGGVLHLIDWIGSEYYPNVTDFIEEVRHLGLSRRIPLTLARSAVNTPDGRMVGTLEALTPASRILSVHARAWIYNRDEYGSPAHTCPRNVAGHAGSLDEMCLGLCWHDVAKAEAVVTEGQGDTLLVERQMPAFNYRAHRRPDGVTPVYGPAVFAAWPISHFDVIWGENDEHNDACDLLDALALELPWRVVRS